MALKLFELVGSETNRPFSPYCWRIRMALAHKGLDVETIAWRFTDKSAISLRCWFCRAKSRVAMAAVCVFCKKNKCLRVRT